MIGLEGHALVVAWAINISGLLILAGALCALIRLVLGPTMPDRVVSLDAITTLSVALTGLFSVASRRPAFIDVAIALALVAFLATVAFAWFAEHRTGQLGGRGESSHQGGDD